MRAVVTHDAGTMGLADVPELAEPAAGQVLVRPEAVGICGSDYHFFTGEAIRIVGTFRDAVARLITRAAAGGCAGGDRARDGQPPVR